MPGPRHLVGVLVELEVGEPEDALVLGLRAGPAEDGVHPGDQLDQREGLRDVVVATDGEPGDLVLKRVTGGEEEHRDPEPVVAQAPGDLEAVEVGEHDVEHDQVGRPFLGRLEGAAAVGGLLDVEPLIAQRGRDRVDDRRFVVDDQDALLAWR